MVLKKSLIKQIILLSSTSAKKKIGFLMVLVGLLAGSSAIAQDPGANAAQATLEEIVVTAQRREQSLQDVSVSVTAVGGDMLIQNGIADVSRLDVLVPGLVFQQAGNDVGFSMRGAVTAQVEANDVSVAFYTDGLYRPRHGQALSGFVDIERVEVLRGPQGTLFGRNSYGGAINVISNKPSFEEYDYGVSLTVGDYSHLRTEGFANVPLGERAAFRLTAVRETRDPYVENITIGDDGGLKDADNWYLRGQFAFEPNDDTSLLLRLERWEDNSNGNGSFGYKALGVPVNSTSGLTNGLSGTLNGFIGQRTNCGGCGRFGAGLDATAESALSDIYKISSDFPPFRDIEETTIAGELKYSGWDFTDVKVTLGYMDYEELRMDDFDFSAFSSVIGGNQITSETSSQEIQFSSKNDGPLEWVAGLYFMQEDLTNAFLWMDVNGLFSGNVVDNAPDPNVAPTYTWAPWMEDIRIDTTSQAIYAQGTYAITDNTRLIAGVRYTDDERDWSVFGPQDIVNGVNGAFAGDNSVIQFTTPLATQDANATWSKVTWKAGIEWDVKDDVMAYLTASTGFLSGNSRGAFTGSDTYDERLVDAYEIGLKSILLDNRMRFNAAIYYNAYDDLLATTFVQAGNTVLAQSDNAGSSNALGLEVEIDWVPVERLSLGLRAAFSQAEYDEFVTGYQFAEGGQTIDGIAGLIRRDGAQVRNSPELTLTLLGSYDFDLGDLGTLTPGITLYYSDDYRAFDRPYTFTAQDSYTKTDLTLGWTSLDGDWNLQAFVRNLEDEAVLIDATVYGGSLAVTDFAAPRTYGLRMGYRF